MKRLPRSWAMALGWTTLALTGLIKPVVGPGKHLALFHWDGSAPALFGPVLLIFTAVWAGATVVLWSAARPGRWRAAVWGGVVLLLPWLLVNALDQLVRPIPWLRVGTFCLGTALLAAYVLTWRPDRAPRLEHTVRRTSKLLQVLAFSGMLCLTQMVWFWWSARDLNTRERSPRKAVAAQASARGRVIWIVFDELSYRQLFEHRYPGLQMPAFDALAAQSAVWTHVAPAGSWTDWVLPSLITGKRVAGIRASASGQLDFRERNGGPWESFSQRDSVFQDALNAGYSTGVVGWFNPYCRIMPAVLDQCFWRMYTELDNGLASDEGVAANLRRAVAAVWMGGLHDPAMTGSGLNAEEHHSGAEGHIGDYRELLARAQVLLADPSASFLLLHMPVPHPGGIYNRATGQFALGGASYVDNMALADRCLATLREQLERRGEWDGATVVVMGDHSWRTSLLWRQTAAEWSAEDERASEGGQFDDRPAYMVKLPGEHSGLRIDTPFEAVRTRQLLDGLIAQRMKTPGAVAAWTAHLPPEL